MLGESWVCSVVELVRKDGSDGLDECLISFGSVRFRGT